MLLKLGPTHLGNLPCTSYTACTAVQGHHSCIRALGFAAFMLSLYSADHKQHTLAAAADRPTQNWGHRHQMPAPHSAVLRAAPSSQRVLPAHLVAC
jgi:hypothetical protein